MAKQERKLSSTDIYVQLRGTNKVVKIVPVVLISFILLFVTNAMPVWASTDSTNALNSDNESDWINTDFNGLIEFEVEKDWVLKNSDNESVLYVLTPELEEGKDVSYLLIEVLGSGVPLKELVEKDIHSTEENASGNINNISLNSIKLGKLHGYQNVFSKSSMFTNYFLYVEKEGVVYRFSFEIVNGQPENFKGIFSEFKKNLAHANWGGTSDNWIMGVVIALIGIAAIIVAIATSYFLARKAERKMKKDSFVVKQMIVFPIISLVVLAFGIFMFVGVFLIDTYNEFDKVFDFSKLDSQALIAIIPCSIVTGIGLFLVYISMRWRILVKGHKAVVTPFVGKTKTINLKDCIYIRLTKSTPGFIAYDENDKKVLSAFGYCRGYVPLVDAISPYVNNSWEIPIPVSVSIPKRANTIGKCLKDIDDYLNEYSENEVQKTVSVKCENCGSNAFIVKMNDVGNAIEIECKECNEIRGILNEGKNCGNCLANEIECPNCNCNEFHVTMGFNKQEESEVTWVYIGIMCVSCGLLDCPADWKVDHVI